MSTLNEKYKVCPHWKLRAKYYPGFGTYIEAYSNIKSCWVVVMKVSILDVSKEIIE